MEDKESLKRSLLELLGEDNNGRMGKKFFFPGNVEKGYNIVQGLSVIDVFKYIVPSLIVSIIIIAIPPYASILFWILKAIVDCIVLSLGIIMAVLRPVASRSNIKCLDYIKMRISYIGKQKMFYIKPKNRGI